MTRCRGRVARWLRRLRGSRGLDNLAGGFEPRGERELRLHLIGAADHQAVGEVDPGGVDPDAHLVRSPPGRFVADSPLEGSGFELVWGFSCQVVVLGFAESSLFGAGKPFFIPSPAIRFPERAEGVKGPKC